MGGISDLTRRLSSAGQSIPLTTSIERSRRRHDKSTSNTRLQHYNSTLNYTQRFMSPRLQLTHAWMDYTVLVASVIIVGVRMSRLLE